MFFVTDKDFPTWLQAHMNQRGWSQSDMARASGINRAVINKVLSSQSKPAPETLESIARALRLPQETVFRAAGLLPPSPSSDPWLDEQNYRLQKLTGLRRSLAERLLKGLEDDEIQAAQEEEAAGRKLKPAER